MPSRTPIARFELGVKVRRSLGAVYQRIDDYLAMGGYRSLAKVLTMMKPADVIALIKKSGLRGRGGGGFPAGVKWETYPDVGEIGKKVKKESKNLTTREMAHVIDHLVDKCLETKVPIRDIWTLWRKWRYAQDSDPLEGQEKAADNALCEACGKPLNAGTDASGNPQRGGQRAHVVSAGAGGPEEEWNLPDLCTECHMTVQHPQGGGELLKRHPDVQPRYDYALRKWKERGEGQRELFTVPPEF